MTIPPLGVPPSVRIQTVHAELESAVAEYRSAKVVFERARVQFEIKRERFARTKELAATMMGSAWYQWQVTHPDVAYTGIQIGDAILGVLANQAVRAAYQFAKGETKQYFAAMGLDQIVQTMESGGFEFNSATPGREVNAALINLARVNKPSPGTYVIAEADDLLKMAQSDVEGSKQPVS